LEKALWKEKRKLGNYLGNARTKIRNENKETKLSKTINLSIDKESLTEELLYPKQKLYI
jgi:hypothetical protein